MPVHNRSTKKAALSRPDDSLRGSTARRVAWALLAAGVMCSFAASATEYRLDVGDVIDISIAQIPELPHRVPVQLDGTISFPLLGSIAVAGMTRSEAEAKIRSALATKIYHATSRNGLTRDIAVGPDDVTATVAEYRPIYVDGDVSKPGEHPYRPLMTVRQAVALSGGYDTLRFRATNPIIEGADLKSDYESLWVEFAKEQAHVWRIKAELASVSDPKQLTLSGLPLPHAALAEIVRVETDALDARQSDHQRQKTFLQRSLQQDGDQIAILSKQKKQEEDGAKADADELQRALELYSKGTLTSPRVTDARRAVLLSSTRALQTAAELTLLQRQQNETARQLAHLEDERRIKLLGELQDSAVRLDELRAKLQGIGDKLKFTALLRSQLVRGNGHSPMITVIRKDGASRTQFEATEDSELQPGDVVEVSLQLSEPSGTPTR
jgi:polysaccharide export outer membrane protein